MNENGNGLHRDCDINGHGKPEPEHTDCGAE